MQNNSSVPKRKPLPSVPKGGKSKKAKPSVPKIAPRERVARSLKARFPQDNPYLMTLVDPENNVGVRYPDELPKATAVFRGLINHNAYVFPTNNGVETDGTYLSVLSPTLINPLTEYCLEPFPGGGPGGAFANPDIVAAVATADDHSGVFPLEEDSATVSTSCDEMWVQPGATMNLKAQFAWRDQDFASPMFRGIRTDNSTFYGFPAHDSGALGDAGVVLNFVQPITTSGSPFEVYAVTKTNIQQLSTVTAPTGGALSIGLQSILYSIDPADYQSLFTDGYVGLPGIGFRLKNITTRPVCLSSYAIHHSSGSTTQDLVPRFRGVSLPDEATYASTIDQYRVVSASNWMEYDGSDLKNGGQVASIMYRGGQSPMENGLYNYQSVAEGPDAYAGKLEEGTYTFWAPNSDNDMLMRSLNPHNRWEFPFIVNAGVVSEPDQLNPIRYRIALNYEAVSTAQFYAFQKPIPHPEWIDEAAMVLRRYPCTMANGRHWDWIKSVAKDMKNFASDAAKWAVENKSWLIPAATSVAALI